MSEDYRDLALQMFAEGEIDLLQRLALVQSERDTYRLMAQEALHKIHDLSSDRERERQERFRLIDENRRLRAAILLREAA
ncbi:MAG: hypothetical protein AB7N65_27875 [Vicinamibacterales bacterium]